jgi:signal transduction histidine kinase
VSDWQNALRTGNFRSEFRTLPSEDSPSRWILSVGRTVTAEGEQPYLVGNKLDITQQKRSAEALMRTEKLAISGRLAASIAHEINNPLEAVTNLLYLLLRTPLNEEQMQYATTLQAELERVSEIVTHTLRFHRQNTLPAPIHVSDLVASILTLYQGRLHNFEVDVEQRLRATRTVVGLGGDLRQVLANLIANAIDAMQGNVRTRKLYLRSCNATHPETHVEGVRITVADCGTGIDAKSVSRIYDAFFTTKPETGTGLGLWVSMEIVNRHGGSLRVRSSPTSTHQGTVFQLFLPVQGQEIGSA